MQSDSQARLQKLLLKEAKVAEPVVSYMLRPQTDILNHVEAFKNDKVVCGRLRSAWELANAEFSALTSKRAQGSSEDYDAPLDPDDQKAQEDLFYNLHRVRLEPTVMPLFARLYREFKKQSISLFPL
eukprot:4873084-Amphidinium_carterae.2